MQFFGLYEQQHSWRDLLPHFAVPEQHPIVSSFLDQTVVYLLRINKNIVQRIFQLKGWQVKKRAHRVQALY